MPSPDVTRLLNVLLDKVERRTAGTPSTLPEGRALRSIKAELRDLGLIGYFSQIDPVPRQVANEQLVWLENAGILRLSWQTGEKGHLLESIVLVPGSEARLYPLLARTSTTSLRSRLESQLLGERFLFGESDWCCRAIRHILNQIKENKSPAPLSLVDPAFNADLLVALRALEQLNEETSFRVFSVRTFNDSKRFEDLKNAVVRLARLGQPGWKRLPEDELLRELNLVPNPTYLLLAGPWTLVDVDGQVLSLGEFSPSVGLPAVQAAHLQRVQVRADRVVCIENLTTFHAMAGSLTKDPQKHPIALLCLAGNPSPACRRVLNCLASTLPENTPLLVWADMDYGGFNILAQLRKQVSPRFLPYNMGIEDLDQFVQFAHPLTLSDRRNLQNLVRHPELRDLNPVISYLLKLGLKLEQEAITVGRDSNKDTGAR